jgi:signal transduction histidine kinase
VEARLTEQSRRWELNLRERAFWTAFCILLSLAVACGSVFAVFLVHEEVADFHGRVILAWHVALACSVLALPPIWLIARLESRWIVRRVQRPIESMVQQCRRIRQGGAITHLQPGEHGHELIGLTSAVNELLDQFNDLVVRQHQFAADAAHELRTPLTAQVVVGENALARRCSSAELREAIGSMLEESKHMRRLIDALLLLTRASANRVTAVNAASREPLAIALDIVARSCVESLQVLAEEKQQRIELNVVPVWADADPTMIRQALLNVIHNAIEHCPEGVQIKVETARFSREHAMVRVSDNGPGIPLEQQEHVFKRFYRGPNASRRRGLGLGLSIAAAVMKSQRGNIHLRTAPGGGAQFTLVLPLLEPDPVNGLRTIHVVRT